MGRTLRHMSTACFLTTVTTAAGFCSLMVAKTTVIRDFWLAQCNPVAITFSVLSSSFHCGFPFCRSSRWVSRAIHLKSYRWFEQMDIFVREETWLVIAITIALVGGPWLRSNGKAQLQHFEMWSRTPNIDCHSNHRKQPKWGCSHLHSCGTHL